MNLENFLVSLGELNKAIVILVEFKDCLMLSITASASIMNRNYLYHISGLSDLPVFKLWCSFMSRALSSPWDLLLECNPGAHRGPRPAGAPRPCASQLPSVQANYLLVL
jgi:hypothetical protein